MAWTQRNLVDVITVWTIGTKDIYGKPTWDSKLTKGRWEYKQEKTVDFLGNEFTSNATVFLLIDVQPGDYLQMGRSVGCVPDETAREVRNFSKIRSIRGNLFERKATLK